LPVQSPEAATGLAEGDREPGPSAPASVSAIPKMTLPITQRWSPWRA
jgi:hypothetical protein